MSNVPETRAVLWKIIVTREVETISSTRKYAPGYTLLIFVPEKSMIPYAIVQYVAFSWEMFMYITNSYLA